MPEKKVPPHGRGAADNPTNRFETLRYERDLDDADPEASSAPATQLFRDKSRSLITTNDSPDIGFDASINPYRGCEHGCAYCYARPTHEYLGLSAGLDFETKILVKEDAPQHLRRELSSPRWQPKTLAMSGVTDPYQPIERRLKITRGCLEVLAEFRNPVGIITKNHLVTRDADLLGELARHQAARAFLSITTLDKELARKLEPRASQPAGRLAAIGELSRAGIPVGVMVAPVIPGLTDHEMPAIIAAAAAAGARSAGYVTLRLPFAVAPLFESWLERHFPERKEKVLGRMRAMSGGKLYDSRFGTRQRGEGVFADMIRDVFALSCRKAGIPERGGEPLSTAAFRRFGGERLLFE
jgi:DNA repair photolyase